MGLQGIDTFISLGWGMGGVTEALMHWVGWQYDWKRARADRREGGQAGWPEETLSCP